MSIPLPDYVPETVARRFSEDLARRLLDLRRDLHRHPELSFEEHRTRERLHGFLSELPGARIQEVAGTGLVARIPGSDPSRPAVAVRGDIDALPIQEETDLPYASEADGVMHACGHDVHATWAAGAASLLAERPAAGDVLVVLQPGEETGEGAKRILSSGILDEARAIFGGHVDRDYEVGQVVVKPGPIAASADFFDITFRGQGGHAARPHETADPLAAAAAAVLQLNGLAPRTLEPDRHSALTVTRFRAGEARNVVPGTAELSGTIRATDPDAREELASTLERVMRASGQAHGVEVEVALTRLVPPLISDERAVDWVVSAARELLGAEGLVPLRTVNLAGEDFAHYLEGRIGCFFRVGAREPGGARIGAHSPRFYAADGSVFVGAALLAESARRAADGLR